MKSLEAMVEEARQLSARAATDTAMAWTLVAQAEDAVAMQKTAQWATQCATHAEFAIAAAVAARVSLPDRVMAQFQVPQSHQSVIAEAERVMSMLEAAKRAAQGAR